MDVSKSKRVVLVRWKKNNDVDVFSNLKNFCLSYPEYNYNTLNNYLSKGKIPYENETVRVERKMIIAEPQINIINDYNKEHIAPVLRRVKIKEAADDLHDLQYWLSQPVIQRVKATTFLVSQMLKKGQRMDKSFVNKIKLIE